MLVQHKTFIFAAIVMLVSSSCTVIDSFPPQRSDAKQPAVSKVVDDSSTPMGKLAAMHDTAKVDIAWVFQYYHLISTVPVKALNEEFENTKKDFSTDKNTWNQWQMAMLLSLPVAPFYDPERSVQLFKELVDNTTDQGPVINDAAFLMYSSVKEQYHASKKAVELEERLTEARTANKTLQEQLEALKAIEENLYRRNKVEVPPKP